MAETSRSQVTITLGRSGQASGDSNRLSTSSADGIDDVHLRKDDLRYKIMRKSGNKQTQSDGQQNGDDLREMLSRPAQPLTASLGMQQLRPKEKNGRQYMPDRNEVRQLMPEVRDVRQHIPETRDVRQRMPETRDVRQRMPETRDVRQRMPEIRDVRQRMPETRDVRQRMPETREVRERMPEMREVIERIPEVREVRERMPETRGDRQRMPETRDDRQRLLDSTGASIMGRIPSARGVDVLPQINSLRNSYSPWTLDRLRRRSPDGVFGTSRVASPPRNEEQSRRRPIIRAYDDVRSAAYLSKDGLELSRPMGTASYMAKSAVAAGPAKPVAPMLATPPPPGVIVHKSSYTIDEQHTVEGLLHSLGLGKYVINFKAEEVDMHALRQMGDNDLKELGIPMGPRKKILLALLPRSRRQV